MSRFLGWLDNDVLHCRLRVLCNFNDWLIRWSKEEREWLRRVRECSHEDTRPNPLATAVLDRNPRICNSCGIGLVDQRLRNDS